MKLVKLTIHFAVEQTQKYNHGSNHHDVMSICDIIKYI